MDPSLIAEQPGGFYGWFVQYGQIVYILVNIVFWIGMLILVGYAVAQYKRWVNYQLGTGRSGALRLREDGQVDEEKPSVEEFVD